MKTNQQILDDAPEGWTHYGHKPDAEGIYLRVAGSLVNYWNSLNVWSVPISNFEEICIHSQVTPRKDIEALVEKDKRIGELRNTINEALEYLYCETDESAYNACSVLEKS